MNKDRSRVRAAISVLGLAMVVAVVGMAPGSAAAQGVGQATYDGVTFNYDTSLATNVRGQTVGSNVGQGGLISEARPEHISFTFDGYSTPGVWTPQIRVIPLAAYRVAHAQTAVSSELAALERYVGGASGGPLPVLPAVNAQRIISENVAPVAGAGVTGVRFVASYAQGILPVAADNITYMFIGLTADKAYYVEGTFPVALSTPLDPPPATLTPENVQAYNQAVAARLRGTGMEGFVPTLDKLDKMMSSIQVAGGAVEPTTPGMPRTGSAQDSTWLLLAAGAAGIVAVAVGVVVRRRTSPPER